jgi:hypothetical protein
VARVIRWLAETLPAETQTIAPEAALQLAQSVAAARLDHFYYTAMHAWQQTSQVKYASLAIRAATALTKLPVLSSNIEGLLAGAEQMTKDPSVGDCSADAAMEAEETVHAEIDVAANGDEATTSTGVIPEQVADLRAFLRTAQPLLTPRADRPVQEVQISPQAVSHRPSAAERTQSRRERRRQLRAKLKAKAK